MKLTFEQFLKEAPLPDDWDKNVYAGKTSFAKQLNYARERAQKLGAGSSRIAFKIEYQGRPTVLKIAKNAKGLAQNEQEASVLEDYYLKDLGITIPMIDYDETSDKPKWLHVEYATKAKDSDFVKICGLNLNQLIKFCAEYAGRTDYKSWDKFSDNLDKQATYENEFVYNLIEYFGNYDHPIGDYSRLANWGIYKGRPVIIDIGLSQDIFKTYYT